MISSGARRVSCCTTVRVPPTRLGTRLALPALASASGLLALPLLELLVILLGFRDRLRLLGGAPLLPLRRGVLQLVLDLGEIVVDADIGVGGGRAHQHAHELKLGGGRGRLRRRQRRATHDLIHALQRGGVGSLLLEPLPDRLQAVEHVHGRLLAGSPQHSRRSPPSIASALPRTFYTGQPSEPTLTPSPPLPRCVGEGEQDLPLACGTGEGGRGGEGW